MFTIRMTSDTTRHIRTIQQLLTTAQVPLDLIPPTASPTAEYNNYRYSFMNLLYVHPSKRFFGDREKITNIRPRSKPLDRLTDAEIDDLTTSAGRLHLDDADSNDETKPAPPPTP